MADKYKNPTERMAEFLAERVIDRFSSVDNWQKSWATIPKIPYNAHTGQSYKGYNALSLLLSAANQGFSDPRWMTFIQAKENGYKIMKGAQGSLIGFFNVVPIDDTTTVPNGLHLPKDAKERIKHTLGTMGIKTYGDLRQHPQPGDLIASITSNDLDKRKVLSLLADIDNGEGKDIVFKNYNVFNAEQIEGIPALVQTTTQDRTAHDLQAVENIIDHSGVLAVSKAGAEPSYSPTLDTVRMPPPEHFNSIYEYYATYMHELAHSTAHENRLSRQTSVTAEKDKKLAYAREELVAEFASLLINARAGLSLSQEHFDNHAAYLKSWSQVISDNPRELFNVIREAGKAAEYVIERAQSPDPFINEARAAVNEKQPPDFAAFKQTTIAGTKNGSLTAQEAAIQLDRARQNFFVSTHKAADNAPPSVSP